MEEIKICEKNIYHVNRKAIAEISKRDNADIGVAARKWAHENGIENSADDLAEFLAYCRALQKEDGKLVAAYFGIEA